MLLKAKFQVAIELRWSGLRTCIYYCPQSTITLVCNLLSSELRCIGAAEGGAPRALLASLAQETAVEELTMRVRPGAWRRNGDARMTYDEKQWLEAECNALVASLAALVRSAVAEVTRGL